jgi:excisionase family DNA binding protein
MLNTGDRSRPGLNGDSRIDDATVCPSMADRLVGRWSSRCWVGVALSSRWWRLRFVVRGWSRRVSVAGARCLVTPRDAGTPGCTTPEPFGRSERIEFPSFAGVGQALVSVHDTRAQTEGVAMRRRAVPAKPKPAEISDRLVSPHEVAAFLGVPLQTIYRWRYRHEGPAGYRVGRHVRYRIADVEHWLEERRDDARR